MIKKPEPGPKVHDETRKRIISKAEELFLKYSFSRVTVDEIVRNLGMSKKTLYRYFPNKKAVIQAVIQMNQAELINNIDNLVQNKDIDYMERLKQIFKVLSYFFSKIPGFVIEDLKNHLPDIWKSIREIKRTVSRNWIRKIIIEGSEKGFFRKDIDPGLIISIYFFFIEEYFLQKSTLEDSFSIKDKLEAIFKIFYSGILTGPARKSFFQGEYNDKDL
ncbi:MAG: TetR/AcrR family transcriptional regulator [Spirochaetales bacterium]|nr:TetR/AcrR family transcriptional regulator [Spirochaetales bacterium]